MTDKARHMKLIRDLDFALSVVLIGDIYNV